MTTIIKIKKEIEEEIEVPAYFDYAGVKKIISSDSCISARVIDGCYQIEKVKDMPGHIANIILNGRPITEEEFKANYTKAMGFVIHEAFMQCSEPATDEEIREEMTFENTDEIFERNEDLQIAINEFS